MCMSCGCKQPNEDHGDERHITMQDLEAAAEADGISVQEVIQNIAEGYQEAGGRETAYSAPGSPADFETGREGEYRRTS